MLASPYKLLVVVILAVPVVVNAQEQCKSSQMADYSLTAESGTPVPETTTRGFSYTQKNETNVLVRLENINPYAFKCSASSTITDYKETAVASFLGTIGGVANVGASTPGVSTTTTKTVTPGGVTEFMALRPSEPTTEIPLNACEKQYLGSPAHIEVEFLVGGRDAINAALDTTKTNQKATLDAFNSADSGVVVLSRQAKCSDTIAKAKGLLSMGVFEISKVEFPAGTGHTPDSLPMDQAIDQVAFQAQALVGHLNDGLSDTCKLQARSYIDEDAAFLSALVVGSSAAPSALEKWRSQLKVLNTVLGNLTNAQNSIRSILGNPQNFTIDTSIHGNQQTVTYTATCSPIQQQNIPALDPAVAAATTLPAPAAPPTTGGGGTPAPTSNTWKHDFRFGPGPRFVVAGGLVISPLQQVTFSTTATPGGSGATANTIIQQQNSSTRILPIAMLHARYWDQLPARSGYALVPNYLSVGITAKSSDNKGTNIEYLFGPSWSFADRQIFITAGAYGGQQQRLANSLTVASTTSLSSANLPITQTTIWKVGFAVTWAPGGK